MKTPQAAIFLRPNYPHHLQAVAPPSIGPKEVLVCVEGCTICGSDVHSWQGKRKEPTPTILGHEIIGRIQQFGSQVARLDFSGKPLSVGDRVAWGVVANCGECFYCQNGLTQKCTNGLKYGHCQFATDDDLHGGFATHCILVPGTAIFHLPSDISLAAVCPVGCATATIVAALETAGSLRGRSMLIIGAGMLGITAACLAKSQGAGLVAAIDQHPGRLEVARQFGVEQVFSSSQWQAALQQSDGGRGYDVVLELTGAAPAMEQAWRMNRIGGSLLLVGAVFPSPPLSIAMEDIVRRQLTIRGVHNYQASHLGKATEFLAENFARFPFESLVTKWFPLEEIDAAFAEASTGQHLRVGVQPSM